MTRFRTSPPRARRRRPAFASVAIVTALLVGLLTPAGVAGTTPGANGLIVFSGLDRTDTNASRRHANLWLTSPQGNVVRKLTDGSLDDSTPAFSPDGRTVAFSRYRETPDGIAIGPWLYLIDTSTGTETLLADQGEFRSPAWSPDGARIAFDGRMPNDPSVVVRIFVISSTGGTVQQLTFGDTNASGPAWSPQGDLIAYSVGGSQIGLMNADGTNQHVIPAGLSYAQTPDWSPDGQWLVVEGVAEGAVNPELFKMRPDGTQLTQLTNSQELPGRADPAWSPDGSVILFQANPGHGIHGSGEFFTVPSNGGMATQVGTRHLEAQATASWQPLP